MHSLVSSPATYSGGQRALPLCLSPFDIPSTTSPSVNSSFLESLQSSCDKFKVAASVPRIVFPAITATNQYY